MRSQLCLFKVKMAARNPTNQATKSNMAAMKQEVPITQQPDRALLEKTLSVHGRRHLGPVIQYDYLKPEVAISQQRYKILKLF